MKPPMQRGRCYSGNMSQPKRRLAQVLAYIRDAAERITAVQLIFEGCDQPMVYDAKAVRMDFEAYAINDIVMAETYTIESEVRREPDIDDLCDDFGRCDLGRDRSNGRRNDVVKKCVLLVTHPPKEILDVVEHRMKNYKKKKGAEKQPSNLLRHAMCGAIALASTRKDYDAKLGDDKEERIVEMVVIHCDSDVVIFRFVVPGRTSTQGWDKQSSLTVHFIPGQIDVDFTPKGNGRITQSDVDVDNAMHTVDISLYRFNPPDIHRHLAVGESVSASLKLMYDSRVDPLTTMSKQLKDGDFLPGSVGEEIVGRVYNTAKLSRDTTAVKFEPDGPEISATPFSATMKEADGTLKELIWDHEQRRLVAAALDDSYIIINLDAGAGTGKTTTITGAILEEIRQVKEQGKKPLILAVAVTNAAVGQIANTLIKFTNCDRSKVLRLVSPSNENEERTPVDSYQLLADMIEADPYIVPSDKENFQDFPTCVKRLLRLRDDMANLDQRRDKDKIVSYTKNIEFCCEVMGKWGRDFLLKKIQPEVVCMTQATLLNTVQHDNGLSRMIKDRVVTLWVDESSQMPETAIHAFAQRLPHAKHRYVGDPAQLQPFCTVGTDRFAEATAAGGVAALLLRSAQVPRLTLRNCRRLHPKLTCLPSYFFYGGSLKGWATPESRNLLTSKLTFPRADTPFALLNVHGSDVSTPNKSRYNQEEIQRVVELVGAMSHAVKSSQIAIICFYVEQGTRVRSAMLKKGLACEVTTVDSAQGKEWDVVIILTTKTRGFDQDFLNDDCRVNVAATRAKHGLFIMGNLRWMQDRPGLWSDIVKYSLHRHMILEAGDAIKRFSPSSKDPAQERDLITWD